MKDPVQPTGVESRHLKRSVMRDLLKLAVDPEIVSFAGGLPASDLMPVAEFAECVRIVAERDGARAFQYSPPFGPLREWIADYMRQRGVRCTPEQVYVTSGAQQALSILSRLFLDPGEPAVIEEIIFTGIQQVTAGRGAAVRAVRTSPEYGVDLDSLETAFRQDPRPRLAVLNSNFQNPLGITLSIEQRERAADLAATYGIPLIEDDPCAPLRFAGGHVPAIKAFDEAGHVLYVGSFSKMLAPAVRLGWLIAPEGLMPSISTVRESFDLETSSLMQRAATEYVTGGYLEPHIEELRLLNGRRCSALLESLTEHLDGIATWSVPEGGMFVWVTLPEEVDAWQLLPEAIEAKVAFIPGGAFSVEGGHANTMRLNFSNVRTDAIPDAVRNLAGCIRQASGVVAGAAPV